MKHVRYVGHSRIVDVPALDIHHLARGEAVEVDDGAAQVLCEQSCWELVEPKKAPAKKDIPPRPTRPTPPPRRRNP